MSANPERFGRLRGVIYSAGTAGFAVLDSLFATYFVYFLLPDKETGMGELVSNKPLLFGATIVGLIVIFGRIVDAVADPLVAHWSDNARFRLGRRRFFLLTGSLPFAMATALLFYPPDDTATTANAIYSMLLLGVYFFFYTYFMTPYLALIPELSRTRADRIYLTILQAVFSIIGGAIVMIGVPQMWEALRGAADDEATIRGGLRTALTITAAIGFALAFVSGLVVDERRFARGEPANIGLRQSLGLTLGNRAFLIYVVPVILFWFGFHIIRATVPYFPTTLAGRDAGFQTLLMTTLFGSAVVSFAMIGVLARFVSNKAIMLAGLLSFAVLLNGTYLIRAMGEHAALFALIQMALLGFPTAVLLGIPNAVLADLSEADAARTGANREAMYFGAQGFLMKVNYGFATALLAYLFAAFGKDAAQPLGIELSGPAAAVFALIGFGIYLAFPQKDLDRRLAEVRAREKAE